MSKNALKNTYANFRLSASFLHLVAPMSEKKEQCKKMSKNALKNS
jgi:hypothetical protein